MLERSDIDFELIKEHCRVYHNDDDMLISSYIDVAIDTINRELEDDWEWIAEKYEDIPKSIIFLVSICVSTMYDHRSDVSDFKKHEVPMPMSYKLIVNQYRTPKM